MPFPWESPDFISDPYPIYRDLRTSDPISFEDDTWILSRYADIVAVLKDGTFGIREVQERADHPAYGLSGSPSNGRLFEILLKGQQLKSPWALWVGAKNPPDHARMRSLVAAPFSLPSITRLQPRIQAATDALLDRVHEAGQMDVIADLAEPLVMRIIGEIIGLPPADFARLQTWSRSMPPTFFHQPSLIDYAWSLVARVAFNDYLRPLLARRRREPQGDLMSLLVQAEAEGKLTAEEVAAHCMTFFFAGQETTSATIGNALLALLRHPQQLQRLRDEPALIAIAVEELLRYDSPSQVTRRVALADVELHGCTFRKNQEVRLLLGAGNRDPAAFTGPDQLALDRAPNPHLAFSQGLHFCLGAHLARLETQIVLSRIIQRLPGLALQDRPLEWRSGGRVRGLKSLAVRF